MSKRHAKVMIGGKAASFRHYVRRDGVGGVAVFFCVGPQLGCVRTQVSLQLSKKPCEDCIQAIEGEQMSDLIKRAAEKYWKKHPEKRPVKPVEVRDGEAKAVSGEDSSAGGSGQPAT